MLAGTSREGILKAYRQCFAKAKTASIPPLWDGKAAERIWGVVKNGQYLCQRLLQTNGLALHQEKRDGGKRIGVLSLITTNPVFVWMVMEEYFKKKWK